jgi:NADPH:quinone reductase-like Zn-dependent oxidoreductase
MILGWDPAGVIEETGYSVKRFAIGDKIFSYGRRTIVPLERMPNVQLFRKAENTSQLGLLTG